MKFLYLTVASLFLQKVACRGVPRDINGVTMQEKMEGMDKVLVESQVASIITPCSVFATGRFTAGEQSSAEWVHIVFHDAITADFEEGTGYVPIPNPDRCALMYLVASMLRYRL